MMKAVRPAVIAATVVAVALGFFHLSEERGTSLNEGTTTPSFSLTSLAGGEVDLSMYRGKLVVLNFWATWCPPCVVEMPSLERLHRSLEREGLVVLAVSTDEDLESLKDFVVEHDLTMPVLLDPGGRSAAAAYLTEKYPATFVLDRRGVLLGHYTGAAEWDTPEALAHFRALLASDTPAR